MTSSQEIKLYDWAEFRGVVDKTHIDIIEKQYNWNLDEYLNFVEENSPTIIEDILPGIYKYYNTFEPVLIHNSFKSDEDINIIINTFKSEYHLSYTIKSWHKGGPDGTTDVYLGMPCADEELRDSITNKTLNFIGCKGVHYFARGDAGIQLHGLEDTKGKLVAFKLC